MFLWFTLIFLASQILAGFAIIADIFSFQFKERKKIIIFFMIAAVCIALHYLLLDRVLAACLLGVGIIRFFISYHSTKTYWIYIFISIFGVSSLLFYKDIYDVVVFIAMSLITVWVFQKDDKHLRQFMMCGTSLVILYNFLIFSPVWVLLESIFLGSNLVGYYRHYIKKRLN
jgi:uncharacterized membrane protein